MSGTTQPDQPVFRLLRDGRGQLVLEWPDGARVEGVVPVRAFPLTDPEGLLSLCDDRGQEVAFLRCLEDLPPPQRELVTQELDRWEFRPRILRVHSIFPVAYPCQWQVDTDRGSASFLVTEEEQIRRVGRGGLQIADSHGIRWWLPDRRALDRRSQRWLARLLS